MKESYLISYKLFCTRKNFSLERFLKQELLKNQNYLFIELKKYLNDRKVQSPDEDHFNAIKKSIIESFQKEKEEKRSKLEEKKVEVKQKTKTRSRRRKSKWLMNY